MPASPSIRGNPDPLRLSFEATAITQASLNPGPAATVLRCARSHGSQRFVEVRSLQSPRSKAAQFETDRPARRILPRSYLDHFRPAKAKTDMLSAPFLGPCWGTGRTYSNPQRLREQHVMQVRSPRPAVLQTQHVLTPCSPRLEGLAFGCRRGQGSGGPPPKPLPPCKLTATPRHLILVPRQPEPPKLKFKSLARPPPPKIQIKNAVLCAPTIVSCPVGCANPAL